MVGAGVEALRGGDGGGLEAARGRGGGDAVDAAPRQVDWVDVPGCVGVDVPVCECAV